MIYKEFINDVREDLKNNLNTFLAQISLDPVAAFVEDGFSVEKAENSLAVYAYSPNGPVYEDDGTYTTVRFTVEFFKDAEDATGTGLAVLEEYFSALAFFITQRRYGGNGIIINSQLDRMDQGDGCNECLFLVEARIDTSMDYSDEYPVPEEEPSESENELQGE